MRDKMTQDATHAMSRKNNNGVSVVIVDDSLTIRRLIRLVLESVPDIRIVAEAANASEARIAIREHAPDVVTLDVEMPGMNGLDFLEKIMHLRPLPVVMISSVTRPNSEQSVRALAAGAVEIFVKPGPEDQERWHDLPQIVRQAACCTPQAPRNHGKTSNGPPARIRTNRMPTQDSRSLRNIRAPLVVAIGSSTGGVDALETILSGFPKDCPPTVIVQHMPEAFLSSFASRLDARFAFEVALATTNARLSWGKVYVAPGGAHHLKVETHGASLILSEGDKVTGHRPSVDVLFESVAKADLDCVAALLTGMGRDGAAGMVELRAAGARTFAQSEESCVVYGMPKAAKDLGGVEKTVHLERMAGAILGAIEDFRAAPARRGRMPSRAAITK